MADTYDVGTPARVMELGSDNVAHESYDIPFVTKPHGVAGVVRVPVTPTFDADARAALDAKAAMLEALYG